MHRWPALSYRIIHRKSVLRRRPVEDMDRYFPAVKDADLVVATGGGYLTDSFPGMVDGVCTTMELAQQFGKPTAMLGQGLGPLTRPELWSRVASVLRRLDLVTLREGEHGPSLLQKAGVSPTRYVVTGDDAIELAYSLRRADRGSAIGVNLRTAGYAGLATESAGRLGHILQATARDLGAPLVSVPISLNRGGEDVRAISELMAGYGGAGDGGASISTPAQCIRQVGSCRLVVTGSYHAGVFALSQGIPAVGIVGSEYYRDKFGGLRAQFGRGCESIALDAPDFDDDLRRTVRRFYEAADDLRHELLEATARQIDTGVMAYERLHDIVRTDVTRSVRQRAAPEQRWRHT